MTDRSATYDRIPLALVVMLAAFLAIGLAVARFGPARDDAADRLPDLTHAQLVEVRDASGRTILSGEFRERADTMGNTERDAALVERGGRHVIGKIEIGIPGPNAMTPAQELEIDIMELQPNTKHSIFIDDREVATFTTDDRGSIDMKIQSSTPQSAPDA
jgi:hypothetical protein